MQRAGLPQRRWLVGNERCWHLESSRSSVDEVVIRCTAARIADFQGGYARAICMCDAPNQIMLLIAGVLFDTVLDGQRAASAERNGRQPLSISSGRLLSSFCWHTDNRCQTEQTTEQSKFPSSLYTLQEVADDIDVFNVGVESNGAILSRFDQHRRVPISALDSRDETSASDTGLLRSGRNDIRRLLHSGSIA